MPNLVGIFPTRDVAELAVQGLLATAISPQSITLLSGEAGKSQVASLTTTDAERDGTGEAVGGIVRSGQVQDCPWAAPLPVCSYLA
jgi:hypothetical protein